MKIYTVFAGALALIASNAMALDPERRALITEPVINFANAIGCSDYGIIGEETEEILIAELGTDESGHYSSYIAFPIVDIECAGGSGTSAFTPTVVRVDEIRLRSYVDLQETSDIEFIGLSTRGLVSVEALSSDRILISAMQYADGDPNCCPSEQVSQIYSKHWGRGGFWLPEID